MKLLAVFACLSIFLVACRDSSSVGTKKPLSKEEAAHEAAKKRFALILQGKTKVSLEEIDEVVNTCFPAGLDQARVEGILPRNEKNKTKDGDFEYCWVVTCTAKNGVPYEVGVRVVVYGAFGLIKESSTRILPSA